MNYLQFLLEEKMNKYNNIPKIVECTVDRPMGSHHPTNGNYYPINYGYVNDIIGGDGEEQDVYILGVDRPIKGGKFKVIAVIHRLNDNEDKWVVCPKNKTFTKKEILNSVEFQEKWFKSEIYML